MEKNEEKYSRIDVKISGVRWETERVRGDKVK